MIVLFLIVFLHLERGEAIFFIFKMGSPLSDIYELWIYIYKGIEINVTKKKVVTSFFIFPLVAVYVRKHALIRIRVGKLSDF